jgi:hypothetical protein
LIFSGKYIDFCQYKYSFVYEIVNLGQAHYLVRI